MVASKDSVARLARRLETLCETIHEMRKDALEVNLRNTAHCLRRARVMAQRAAADARVEERKRHG